MDVSPLQGAVDGDVIHTLEAHDSAVLHAEMSNDGEIVVESALGKGTTVTVRFPPDRTILS